MQPTQPYRKAQYSQILNKNTWSWKLGKRKTLIKDACSGGDKELRRRAYDGTRKSLNRKNPTSEVV